MAAPVREEPTTDNGVKVAVGRSPVRGPSAAPVTIIEFADYSCGVCQQAETVMKQVLAKYPGAVRVAFKFMPLVSIHPDAKAQAVGADCAAAQGQFAAFHDALMSGGVPAASMPRLAKSVGIDVGRWSACVKKGGTGRVREDLATAERIGVQGTPSFVIKGQLYTGMLTLEQLTHLVDSVIRPAGASGY